MSMWAPHGLNVGYVGPEWARNGQMLQVTHGAGGTAEKP